MRFVVFPTVTVPSILRTATVGGSFRLTLPRPGLTAFGFGLRMQRATSDPVHHRSALSLNSMIRLRRAPMSSLHWVGSIALEQRT
jgi:hypothetical protein